MHGVCGCAVADTYDRTADVAEVEVAALQQQLETMTERAKGMEEREERLLAQLETMERGGREGAEAVAAQHGDAAGAHAAVRRPWAAARR